MIKLQQIQFFYNYPSSPTNYFQGNIGDKIRVTYIIEIF